MKVWKASKRRWFTPLRQARIAYHTRWNRLECAVADAFLSNKPALAAVQALKAAVLGAVLNAVIRPIVQQTVLALKRPAEAGLFSPTPGGHSGLVAGAIVPGAGKPL